MSRWQPWDVLDGAYPDDTRPWSSQDTVNYLLVPAEQGGTLSSKKLVGVPGLDLFCDLGTDAPLRGTHNAEGTFLAVSENTLFRVSTGGVPTAIGSIPGVGRVIMAHNKQANGTNQVGIATGDAGYVYNTGDSSLVQITDDGFPGARDFDFVDGYLTFTDPFGRFFGWSDLQNALSYNTLDRTDAESQPDRILRQIVSSREICVFGTRTGEFFRNTGAATGTFQRMDGTETNIGIANTHAVAMVDNTLYWLGNDGLVYRYVNGHLPQIVSTGPYASLIASQDIGNCFAFAWEDRKHKVFYLTFPSGQTFGYDVWTDRWHRRQSYGMDRWRINTMTKFGEDWIAGDFSNGRLYRLNWDTMHEAGRPLVSSRRFAVAADNGNALVVNGVKLIMDTGVGGITIPPGLGQIALTGTLANGVANDAYTTGPLTVVNGVAPYFWSMTSYPGISIDEDTGIVSVNAASGAYPVVVTVTDVYGQQATSPQTIDIAFSPDLLAMSSVASQIQLRSGQTTAYTLAQNVLPAAISAPLLYSTSGDGAHFVVGFTGSPFVRVWDRNLGGNYIEVTTPLDIMPPAACDGVAISNDGNFLALTQGAAVWLYQADGDGTYTRVTTHTAPAPVYTLKFSPDGNYLALAGDSGIRVLQRSGTTLTSIFTGGITFGNGIAWNRDSNRLAFAPGFNVPQMYSVVGSVVTLLGQGLVSTTGQARCVLSPDGDFLFIQSNTGPNNFQIHEWDGSAFTLLSQASVPVPLGNPIIDMSFSGRQLAISDLTTGTRVYSVAQGVPTLVATIPVLSPGSHFARSVDYPS